MVALFAAYPAYNLYGARLRALIFPIQEKKVNDRPVPSLNPKATVLPKTVALGRPAPILMYHHIRSHKDLVGNLEVGLLVTSENFKFQVNLLKANGYPGKR